MQRMGPPITSAEEQLLFHQQHSIAITQFAILEQLLADLVASGAGLRAHNGVRAAFLCIESFRGKLEFADRLVQRRVESESRLLEEWQRISSACGAVNTDRNRLVHWGLITYTGGVPGRRIVLASE
jgi:hypothetical protein